MQNKPVLQYKAKIALLPCVTVTVNHKDRKQYRFLYDLDKTNLVVNYTVIGDYGTWQDHFSFYCYTEADAKELVKQINEHFGN